MILGERNWCSTDLRRRDLVFYCSQENKNGTLLLSRKKKKETGALLFLGEENRCSTVFRRSDLVLNCSQEKETGALLLSRRMKLVLYCSCFQKKGTVLGRMVTGLY